MILQQGRDDVRIKCGSLVPINSTENATWKFPFWSPAPRAATARSDARLPNCCYSKAKQCERGCGSQKQRAQVLLRLGKSFDCPYG